MYFVFLAIDLGDLYVFAVTTRLRHAENSKGTSGSGSQGSQSAIGIGIGNGNGHGDGNGCGLKVSWLLDESAICDASTPTVRDKPAPGVR